MKKEQQDLAWKCLPKEVRDEIKRIYNKELDANAKGNETAQVVCATLLNIFNAHNLTSDEEPPELLFVERKDVINFFDKYIGNPTREVNRLLLRKDIKALFGDKCLPDKEPFVQSKPKFKVGDKVKVVENNSTHIGEIVTLVRKMNDNWLVIDNSNDRVYFRESSLEPYTEPETKSIKVGDKVRVKGDTKVREVYRVLPDGKVMFGDKGSTHLAINLELVEPETKDNMGKNRCEKCGANTQQCADAPCQNHTLEEKELNLVELLKGCEGETFFSLIDGEVKLKQLTDDVICQYHKYHCRGYLSGCALDGVVQLFPSRDLYEKYPLDAYSAWMEWKSERTPKRWRAEQNKEFYYFLDSILIVNDIVDSYDYFCNNRYKAGNYFRTKEEAQQAAEAVRECLMKFHEKNSEK